MNPRKYLFPILLVLLLVPMNGCAALSADLAQCTGRVISQPTQTSTISAFSQPETPQSTASTTPASSSSTSSTAASLPWESAVDNLAQDGLQDVACVAQDLVTQKLSPAPTASAAPASSPAAPVSTTQPVALLSAPLLDAAVVPAAAPASASTPLVTPAILSARAQTWLSHHCPGGKCSMPHKAKSPAKS
jgi:hypothetical protein